MIRISIVEEGGAPRLVTFNQEQVTIGRVADNDLCLGGKGVSTRHARIFVAPDGMYIEDSGSTNGTYVNRNRVAAPVRVSSADEIVLAIYQLRVLDGSPATTAAAPPSHPQPPAAQAPVPRGATTPVPPPAPGTSAPPAASGPSVPASVPTAAPPIASPATAAPASPISEGADPKAVQWAREWEKIDILARDWLARGRDRKRLLAGHKLSHAKKWLAGGRGRQPTPKREHHQFIKASHQASQMRMFRNVMLGGLVLGAIAAAVIFVVAKPEVEELQVAFAGGMGGHKIKGPKGEDPKARRAASDALAKAAQGALEASPDVAALVSIEGLRRLPATHGGSKAEQVFRSALDRLRFTSLPGHDGPIHDVAFSPDGRWAATAGEDRSARLWDLTSAGAVAPLNLRGHSQPVRHLAVTPDGKYLFTGGDGGKLIRWTLQDADPSSTFTNVPGHEAAISAIAVSGDGRVLVTGAVDGSARIYDIAKAGSARLSDHTGPVRAVAVDGKSTKVLTGGADMTAMLYTLSDGRPGRKVRLEGHEAEIRSAALAADASWAITGSDDGMARLWDPGRRFPALTVLVLAGHSGPVTHAVITNDSALGITGGEDGKLMIWNLQAKQPELGAQAFDLHKGAITDLVTIGPGPVPDRPRPRFLLSASADGTARTWNLETRERAQESVELASGSPVRGIAASPDGRWVVTGGDDGLGRLWDPAEEGGVGPARVARAKENVLAIALNDVGTRLATAGVDGSARLWDVISSGPVKQLSNLGGHEGRVRAVAFTPNSEFVATGGDDGTVRLWKADGAEPNPRSLPLKGHKSVVNGLAFTLDGSRLVSISADRTARVWKMTRDPSKTVTVLPHKDEINSMGLSRDGRWLFTGTISRLRLWDLAAPELTKGGRELKHPHEKDIKVVAVGPDGKFGLSASEDAVVMLWNLAEGRKEARLRQHEEPVDAAAFSADGKRLATGSRDKTIRLYDLTQAHAKESSLKLVGHEGRVAVLRFSQDGRLLVSGSGDNTIRIWDLRAGDAAAISSTSTVLRGHDGLISDLRVASDGRFVVSGSYDGSARIWPLNVDDLIEIGCRRVGRSLTPEEWTQYAGTLPYRTTCESR